MSDKDTRVLPGTFHGRKGRVIVVADGEQVPEGAIAINRTIVADMKYQTMKNKPLSEIWPSYGGSIIAGTTWALTAIGAYNVRRKLKLFSGARSVCYLYPLGPAMLTGVIHHEYVVKSILENRDPECSVCLPLRSTCINILCGWMLPSALTMFATSYSARRSYSYPIPPVTEFRPFLNEMNKVTRNIRPIFGATLLLSAIIPFVLAMLEKTVIENFSTMSVSDYEQQVLRLNSMQKTQGLSSDAPS